MVVPFALNHESCSCLGSESYRTHFIKHLVRTRLLNLSKELLKCNAGDGRLVDSGLFGHTVKFIKHLCGETHWKLTVLCGGDL